MDKLVGGAFVILPHEGDGLKVSQAVIEGRCKDDIQLADHQMTPLEKTGGNRALELRGLIQSFAKDLIARQEDPKAKIPVSCGTANHITATGMAQGFCHKIFRTALSGKTKKLASAGGEIRAINLMAGGNSASQDMLLETQDSEVTFAAMRDIFKNGIPQKKKFLIDPRAYATADEYNEGGLDVDERQVMFEMMIGPDFVQAVLDELNNVLDNLDGEPTETLLEMTREAARRYAEVSKHQFQQRQVGGDNVQRFISIAHDWDVRNHLFKIPKLREVFAAEFLPAAGFRHNVCLKTTWDPKSPPFGDVIATFLADQIDKRDGTDPNYAMVHHNS